MRRDHQRRPPPKWDDSTHRQRLWRELYNVVLGERL
eukprot:CAMPEP_0181192360 /NCGR_PEP_ID=MMETSP1096-20121128/13243_1 /TAXON_ID=156174 ORGANISM="Chrysochromulina ericina, Strain CCMP281" /NCGR_SAMPLE_ID=MMETSP1096 /ASSEMBLY_ACC=CAM_ASM_000453 /LENGTH=35 /DNA_ID= /DNA_START= /DNA_END= /DNA_ORIENTATION=